MTPVTPRRIVAATAAGLLLIIGIALASRALNSEDDQLGNPNRTDDTVVIGVVARRPSDQDETLRGLRLWFDRVEELRGLPYNQRDLAAVKLEVEETDGSSAGARKATRRLIAKRATFIVGPREEPEIIAATAEARDSGSLYLSPVSRPVSVARGRTLTFLARPGIADFSPALDVLERLRRGARGRNRGRSHVAILAATGTWAARADRAARLARARGYKTDVVGVRGGAHDALEEASRSSQPEVVLVSAPFERGLRWFREPGLPRTAPWVLSAESARDVVAGDAGPVAVVMPWSPTSGRAGAVFGPREMAELYLNVYGEQPTVDAAAGTALGILVQALIQRARSTDPGRVLLARESLAIESFWGTLRFVNGEQDPTPSAQLVLADGEDLRSIWPEPPDPPALRRSVPSTPPEEPETSAESPAQ